MYSEQDQLYYHGYDASKTAFWANKETGLSKTFGCVQLVGMWFQSWM